MNKGKFKVILSTTVYASYLFSSYFEYLTESFFLWQLSYIIFFSSILAFDNQFLKKKIVFFFNLYLGLTFVNSIVFHNSGINPSTLLRFSQYFISLNYLIYILHLNNLELKFSILFHRIITLLFKLVIIWLPIQAILRYIYFPLSLSEHQYFRRISKDLYASTSFFYEARGLTQFLIIFLFYFLFLYKGKNRKLGIFLSSLGIIFTFSLSGSLLLIIVFCVFLLKNYKYLLKLKTLMFAIVTLTTVFIFLSNSTYGNNFERRINGMVSNLFHISPVVLLENSWKLNHVDHYAQYSDEFIEKYGFHGGSETVSTVSEISYLYILFKDFNFVLGKGPSIKERYVTLNAIVDIISRIGLIGLILIFFIIKRFSNRNNILIFSFLVLFCFIDGSTPKPQIPFLIGILITLNNFSQKRYDFFNPSSFQQYSQHNKIFRLS